MGALAVALGVGIAVAAAPGIAWAQPTDSGGATADTPSSDPSAAGDDRPAESNPASSTDGSSFVEDDSSVDDESLVAGVDVPSGEDDAVVDDGSAPDTSDTDAVEGLGDALLPGDPVAASKSSRRADRGQQKKSSGLVVNSVTDAQAPSVADADVALFAASVVPALSPSSSPRHPLPGMAGAVTPTTRVGAETLHQNVAVAPTITHDQPAPLDAVATVVSKLVTGLFAPLAGPGPGAPAAPSPILWAAAALTRRDFSLRKLLFNQTPQATAQTVVFSPSTPAEVSGPFTFNAQDPDGDALTYTIVEAPQRGTVSIDRATGQFRYDPQDSLAQTDGVDTFTVQVADRGLHLHGPLSLLSPRRAHIATATVTVKVDPTKPLVAATDTYTTREDQPLTTTAASGVLANDTGRTPLSAALASGPAHGTLIFNADGSFTYTSTTDFAGSDSFTYRVTDGRATATGLVTLDVGPVADTPTLTVTSPATADEDTAIVLTVTTTLRDSDGSETLDHISITGVPAGATLSKGTQTASGAWTLTADDVSGPTALTITPVPDRSGPITLHVSVTSRDGTSTAASDSVDVVVSVAAVADKPSVTATSPGGAEDTAIPLIITPELADKDGSETLDHLTITGVPDGATLSKGTLTAPGTWNLTAAEFNTADALTITPPLDSADPITLHVTVTSRDGTDTATSEAASLTVTVARDNPDDHEATGSITIGRGAPIDIVLSGDGRVFVANPDGTVSVIDTATNELIDTDPTTPGTTNPITLTGGQIPRAIAVSPDSSRLYVATDAGQLWVYNTATYTQVDANPGAGNALRVVDNPTAIAVVAGRVYVAGSPAPRTGAVTVINASTLSDTYTVVGALDTKVGERAINWEPVAMAAASSGRLYVVTQDVHGYQPSDDPNALPGDPHGWVGSAISPTVAAENHGDTDRVYFIENGTTVFSYNHSETGFLEPKVELMDLPADGDSSPLTIAVGGGWGYVANGNGTVTVFDTTTNTLVDADPNVAGVNSISLPSGVIPTDMAITPDGASVYVSGTDGKIHVVNAPSAAVTVA